MKILKLSVVFILFGALTAYSENIRGPVVRIIDEATLSSSETLSEFDISVEDLFAVTPDFSNLPDRISIEIRSSETIKRFRDSFSLYLYTDVSPDPSAENSSYTGKYTESKVIPDRTRFFIDLVLNRNAASYNSLKGTEIIRLDSLKSSRPLIFTILPVMKGVPDYLFSEKFKIKIKSYWPEMGSLNISVFSENDTAGREIDSFSLLIDGKAYEAAENISLTSGIHSVSVSKKGFIDHVENISVVTNETRDMKVILRKNNPVVTVYSPDESVLYIDGEVSIKKKIIDLEPGEHSVVFKLGDYSLSRNILLEEGKNYIINLLLDIEVKEE